MELLSSLASGDEVAVAHIFPMGSMTARSIVSGRILALYPRSQALFLTEEEEANAHSCLKNQFRGKIKSNSLISEKVDDEIISYRLIVLKEK